MFRCMGLESFFHEWVALDTAEQAGRISEHEAHRLKRGVFVEMIRRGLTPADVLPPGDHSLFRSAMSQTR